MYDYKALTWQIVGRVGEEMVKRGTSVLCRMLQDCRNITCGKMVCAKTTKNSLGKFYENVQSLNRKV